MSASFLDGKALALRVRDRLALEVARFRETTGIVPGLTVVLVGDDPGKPGLCPQTSRKPARRRE